MTIIDSLTPASFAPKDPAEIVLLAFDFADAAGPAVTLSGSTVSVSVHRGADANPSAILSGSPTINGLQVLQRVVGGLGGVTYSVKAQVDASDGSRYVLAGLLPVRSA